MTSLEMLARMSRSDRERVIKTARAVVRITRMPLETALTMLLDGCEQNLYQAPRAFSK